MSDVMSQYSMDVRMSKRHTYAAPAAATGIHSFQAHFQSIKVV